VSAFYLKDINAVFVHIPKTGGSSIRGGLFKNEFEGPLHLHWPEHWPLSRSFAFVRDPVERFLSGWRNKAPNWPAREVIRVIRERDGNYFRFQKNLKSRLIHHLLPQSDPLYRLWQVKQIGWFGRLETDLSQILNGLGHPMKEPLPKHNSSHHVTNCHLTPEEENQVNQLYQCDLKLIAQAKQGIIEQ
jgi:hypothetical protein